MKLTVESATTTSRRNFTVYGIASLISAGQVGKVFAATASAPTASAMTSQDVTIENFSEAGKSEGTTRVAKIVKTDAEWKNLLSSDSYQVTRHEGTERPYSGKYEHNHADGIYRCICCNTAVFDSRTKFESGTGWPSFWQPISRLNVLETTDRSLGMSRTAVSCRLCNAHLGHVFDDGPKPTGLRYCMNSVSLNFAARA